MQVANECGHDLACYGKKLTDPVLGARRRRRPSPSRFSGDAKKGIAAPARGDEADHHHGAGALSRSTRRSCSPSPASAPEDCKECIDKLDKQIERDEKAVRIPGARDLLGETRVTAAIIQNQGAGDVAAAGSAAAAAPIATAEPTEGAASKSKASKGKAKGGKHAKAGGKKKHK